MMIAGALKIGDKVQWTSAGSVLNGIIENIDLSLNDHQELVVGLSIEVGFWRWDLNKKDHLVCPITKTRLCGTYDYLKEIELEIIQ